MALAPTRTLTAGVGFRAPFAQNLFDAEWREVQFATESQLAGESAPVEEIHFVPGWPFTIMGRLTAYF